MRYATAELCHVSVLCIGVRDLGRAEWSHRCCTGSTFRRILITPTSHEHLTLAETSLGLPCSVGILGYSVHSWAYKYCPFFRLSYSQLCLRAISFGPFGMLDFEGRGKEGETP